MSRFIESGTERLEKFKKRIMKLGEELGMNNEILEDLIDVFEKYENDNNQN
jgi:hypothetical protein